MKQCCGPCHSFWRYPAISPVNDNITALILAGGAGRRVAHRDKGLINWQGKPFVAHVSDRLATQVAEIVISCNRNFSLYSKYGARTVADTRRDFQGPLAGIEAAASVIRTELLVVVSCDTPHLPQDLVTRLIAPLLGSTAAEISYAFDGVRAQYLCAAMRSSCLNSLPAFLDEGQRAVKDWYARRNAVAVDFADHRASFQNYNTLAQHGI